MPQKIKVPDGEEELLMSKLKKFDQILKTRSGNITPDRSNKKRTSYWSVQESTGSFKSTKTVVNLASPVGVVNIGVVNPTSPVGVVNLAIPVDMVDLAVKFARTGKREIHGGTTYVR